MMRLGRAGLLGAILAGVGASLLGGCARSPGTLPRAVGELTMEIALNAPAQPQYYYFFAVDANNDESDGPVPIVGGGPFWTGSWFNGWGMISNTNPPQEPSDYVLYHGGVFQQFHRGSFIGVPFRRSVSEGGRRLSVTVDLETITTTAPPTLRAVEISFITVDSLGQPETPIRENYDALGEWPGVGFWWIGGFGIDVSHSTGNSEAMTPERADDVPGDVPALDIVDWSVTVNLPE